MPKCPRLFDEVGASLLELVVASAVIGLVLGVIYSLMISNTQVYARSQVSYDMHANARLALPPLTRALLSVGLDPTQAGSFGFVDNAGVNFTPVASDTVVTYTLDANGDGVLQENSNEVQGFRLVGAAPPFTLQRLVITCPVPPCGTFPAGGGAPCGLPPCAAGPAGAVTWALVARGIQGLQFLFFDAAGNSLPNPAVPPYTLTAAQRALIRQIVVQVTVQETGRGLLGGQQFRYTLSSAVSLRNLRDL